jgi:drug/metabolite transporter (DMT)-like permease
VIFFSERLSSLQWIGSAIVLGGVAVLSMTLASSQQDSKPSPNVQRPEP